MNTSWKVRSHLKSRSRSKSATHEQYTSQYQINHEEITLSSILSRHLPKCDTPQIAKMWQSRKCKTNHDGQKDKVKITSHTPH